MRLTPVRVLTVALVRLFARWERLVLATKKTKNKGGYYGQKSSLRAGLLYIYNKSNRKNKMSAGLRFGEGECLCWNWNILGIYRFLSS